MHHWTSNGPKGVQYLLKCITKRKMILRCQTTRSTGKTTVVSSNIRTNFGSVLHCSLRTNIWLWGSALQPWLCWSFLWLGTASAWSGAWYLSNVHDLNVQFWSLENQSSGCRTALQSLFIFFIFYYCDIFFPRTQGVWNEKLRQFQCIDFWLFDSRVLIHYHLLDIYYELERSWKHLVLVLAKQAHPCLATMTVLESEPMWMLVLKSDCLSTLVEASAREKPKIARWRVCRTCFLDHFLDPISINSSPIAHLDSSSFFMLFESIVYAAALQEIHRLGVEALWLQAGAKEKGHNAISLATEVNMKPVAMFWWS